MQASYWHYMAVHYWRNVVRNRQAYCLNRKFFILAGGLFSEAELLGRIWEAVPPEILHGLETRSESYLERLNRAAPFEAILLVLWNHVPSREYVRATLLKMAEEWLCNRMSEGVAGVPSERIDAAREVEICIEKGLLVPPGMCDTPERLRAFIDAALRRNGQKVTDRSKADS